MEGFHGNGGVTLQRTAAGVRIRWYIGGMILKTVDWDPNTWASGVASVSAEGENAETFQTALEFWQGERAEEGPPVTVERPLAAYINGLNRLNRKYHFMRQRTLQPHVQAELQAHMDLYPDWAGTFIAPFFDDTGNLIIW